ncbi:MAG: F0F1-type ATP synthase assembly protein I [Psychroserpens sp.]
MGTDKIVIFNDQSFFYTMTDKKDNRSSWAIGGGLLIGMGIGFFFLEKSPLAFIGCMFIGLGVGLLISAILSKNKQ